MITEEKNVELTSVTTQRYYIIIIDANGETKTEAEAGNTYNIKAAGRDGWDFTGWVVDNADVVSQLDLTKADNQGFVMPAGTDVTITATYKKQRTVTVIGGTVNSTDSVPLCARRPLRSRPSTIRMRRSSITGKSRVPRAGIWKMTRRRTLSSRSPCPRATLP